MKCGVDPETALAEEHYKLVRYNRPATRLRDKGQLHVREMLEKEGGEHAILSGFKQTLFVFRTSKILSHAIDTPKIMVEITTIH